jgi:hypothetical protein
MDVFREPGRPEIHVWDWDVVFFHGEFRLP